MSSPQSMITVRDLTKSFQTGQGKVDVLKGVSMEIKASERIAIVGASGAGKTTFMHLLGGLDRSRLNTKLVL